MKIRLKKLLNKYKNRIFSFFVVFAFVPLFVFSASAEVVLDLTNSYRLLNKVWVAYTNDIIFDDNNNRIGSSSGYLSQGFFDSTDSGLYLTNFPSYSNVNQIYFEWQSSDSFVVLNDLYDYYLYGLITIESTDINDFTFKPDKITLSYRSNDNSFLSYSYDNFLVTRYSGYNDTGYTFSCKLDLTDNHCLSIISLTDLDKGVVGENMIFWFMVVPVPKGTDEQLVHDIVSAINNQTDTLGGYIDKGNDSTGGIVSGNNSAIGELDEVVSEYHSTEQQFFDDFNTNQQAITSDIVGWSWGGLVNCANWVGDTMTDYYNNMGDFRQYIIYPLMLGIVLFFLGRGGSIIGHLFRKPTETTVNTKSVFRRVGNTRYTTTTTSKQGGVFRR